MSEETDSGRRPDNANETAHALAEGEVIDAEFEDAEQGDLDADPAESPTGETPSAKSRSFSVGVILMLALAVAGVLALFIWRPWRGGDAAVSQNEAAPVVLPAPETTASGPQSREPAAVSAVEEAIDASKDAPGAPAGPDPSKIANTNALGDKAALDELAPAEDGGRALPAAPSTGGGNENLQRAAKDAAALFREEAAISEGQGGPAKDAPQGEEPAIRFELEEPADDAGIEAQGAENEAEKQAYTEGPEAALAALQEEAEAAAAAEARGEAIIAEAENAGPERAPVENSADDQSFADNGEAADGDDEMTDEALQTIEAPADAEVEKEAPLSNAKIANNAGNDNIDALAKDVAALKAMFTDENARLSDELAAERSRAASLEKELSAARAELRAKVENNAAPRNALPPASSFAFLALTQKAQAGAPFDRELALFRKSAPAAPGLEVLARFAETGAPTLGALKPEFEDAIRAALAADANAERRGVAAAMGERLGGLVSVRPAGPQEGMSAPAVISRAEALLAKDDLAGAVRELKSLQAPSASAAADWLARAEARVAIDGALLNLSTALAERAAQ